MNSDLYYFIFLNFYFLPIIILISLIISWVIKKTIKNISRHLANLISLTPIILLFLIYIFLFPKYNSPTVPLKINNQLNINTYQTKICKCFGFEFKEFSGPNTYCSGISYACKPGEKYLPF